jgi:hypothetical protein
MLCGASLIGKELLDDLAAAVKAGLLQPIESIGEVKVAEVLAQVVNGDVVPDVMRLQKPVDLVSAREAEEPAQFSLAEPPFLVFFKAKAFERTTRQIIAASNAEVLREIVGDFQIDLH